MGSILDELGAPTASPSSPMPSVLDTLEQQPKQEDLFDKGKEFVTKAGDFYNRLAEWSSKKTPVGEADVAGVNFLANVIKDVTALGVIAPAELLKLEVGGAKEWIKNPKGSMEAIKDSPAIVGEMVLMPMIEDVKEAILHPIKYTYEKPLQQLMNISILTGLGAGVKGIQTANRVSKAQGMLAEATQLASKGMIPEAEAGIKASMEAMGKNPSKSGLEVLNPSLGQLTEDLRYQKWLQEYSPLTSRGVKGGEDISRTVRPLSTSKQLGPLTKEPSVLAELEKNAKSSELVTLYHGTFDREASLISKEGLKVNIDKSYLTSSLEEAKQFGDRVIEVKVPKNLVEQAKNAMSPGDKNTYISKNLISPENITRVLDSKSGRVIEYKTKPELKTTFKNTEDATLYGQSIAKHPDLIEGLSKRAAELGEQIEVVKKEGLIAKKQLVIEDFSKKPYTRVFAEIPEYKGAVEFAKKATGDELYQSLDTMIKSLKKKKVKEITREEVLRWKALETEFNFRYSNTLEELEQKVKLSKNYEDYIDYDAMGLAIAKDSGTAELFSYEVDNISEKIGKVVKKQKIAHPDVKREYLNLKEAEDYGTWLAKHPDKNMILDQLESMDPPVPIWEVRLAISDTEKAIKSLARKGDLRAKNFKFIDENDLSNPARYHKRPFSPKEKVWEKSLPNNSKELIEHYNDLITALTVGHFDSGLVDLVGDALAKAERKGTRYHEGVSWESLHGKTPDLRPKVEGKVPKEIQQKEFDLLVERQKVHEALQAANKTKREMAPAWKTAEQDAKFYIGETPTSRGRLKISEIHGTGLKANETINPNADLSKPVVVVKTSNGYQLLDGRNRIAQLKKSGVNEVDVVIADKSLPKPVTEHIRESILTKAENNLIPPEGQADVINYDRWLREKASGKVSTKVMIEPVYQGDYYSIKPATYSLPKAKAETIDSSNRIFNHFGDTIRKMRHPQHGQPFVTPLYKAEGDIPNMPERVYPWIRTDVKAPPPMGEIGKIRRAIGSPGAAMRDAWGIHNPLTDAFEANQIGAINTENSYKWLTKLTKSIPSADRQVKTAMTPYLNDNLRIRAKLAITTDEAMRETLAKMEAMNLKNAYMTQVALAKEHPDVRIALYAEGALPGELVSIMTTKELRVAENIKKYYEKTGKDMERVGLPTISGKAYTRHMISDEMKKTQGDWTKLPDYVKQHIPKDMAFAHRTGEFNWYPTAIGSLNQYIPIVERKLAMAPYLTHWREPIMQAAMNGSLAAQEAWDMITKNMNRSTTPVGKAINALTSTNYFLQLFGSTRVALKHIIGGVPGSVSEVGIFNSLNALKEMVLHPTNSKELMRTYARMEDIVRTLDTSTTNDLGVSRFMKALQGQPTASCEYLESGINILGNLMRAEKMKNIDPELLRSYLWNKVTSINFRGGWDIPKVFSSPAGRLAFQYSLEPHKVWEYRTELVKRALAGEKDIFGKSYGAKLVQYIMLIGAMETVARSYGRTIVDTLTGTPYVDLVSPTAKAPGFKSGEVKVKFGPGVQFLGKATSAAMRGDILNVIDKFVNHGLESGVGIIGQLMKGSTKLPAPYKDMVSYLMGMPEVKELEARQSSVRKFLNYRTEVQELQEEKKLISKNPVLKHLVLYKRDFRKAIRNFLKDPSKAMKAVYQPTQQPSVLDEIGG